MIKDHLITSISANNSRSTNNSNIPIIAMVDGGDSSLSIDL
jgi:hypothetical protein